MWGYFDCIRSMLRSRISLTFKNILLVVAVLTLLIYPYAYVYYYFLELHILVYIILVFSFFIISIKLTMLYYTYYILNFFWVGWLLIFLTSIVFTVSNMFLLWFPLEDYILSYIYLII